MQARVMGLALLLGAFASSVRAHGDLHDQIDSLSATLRADPKNAVLVHKRGELHRAHGDYAAALADYRRAERLDPQLHVVLLSRGRTLLELGKAAPAERSLTEYLRLDPKNTHARLLRARASSKLRRHAAAEADFARALAETVDPSPELFLERARNLELGGEPAAALVALEDGLRRIGAIITLQHAALALELELRRFDAALARVETMLATAPRKEALLARKAEILGRAGRDDEAAETRAQALAAIDALPSAKRALASTRKLQADLLQAR